MKEVELHDFMALHSFSYYELLTFICPMRKKMLMVTDCVFFFGYYSEDILKVEKLLLKSCHSLMESILFLQDTEVRKR